MSAREKWSVSQPESYKEFDKSGRSTDKDTNIQGENELELFAPVDDPELGLETKTKKRSRSRKDKSEEEESSELGPNIMQKEITIERDSNTFTGW